VDEGQPKTQSPRFLAHRPSAGLSTECTFFVLIPSASDTALKRDVNIPYHNPIFLSRGSNLTHLRSVTYIGVSLSYLNSALPPTYLYKGQHLKQAVRLVEKDTLYLSAHHC